jgi:hypothetical protein
MMQACAFAAAHFPAGDAAERPLPSGAVFRMDRPAIALDDLAQMLSVVAADTSAHGYYSLAQRAVHLANFAAAKADAVAGLHALLLFAPLALFHFHSPAAASCAGVEEALARSFGLGFPRGQAVQNALDASAPELRLCEITYLHRNAGKRLAQMRLPARRAHVRITPWPPEHARKEFLGTWCVYADMVRHMGHA